MSSATTERDRTLQLTLTADEADIFLGLLNRIVDALWDSHGDVFGRALWLDHLKGEDELDEEPPELDDSEIPY